MTWDGWEHYITKILQREGALHAVVARLESAPVCAEQRAGRLEFRIVIDSGERRLWSESPKETLEKSRGRWKVAVRGIRIVAYPDGRLQEKDQELSFCLLGPRPFILASGSSIFHHGDSQRGIERVSYLAHRPLPMEGDAKHERVRCVHSVLEVAL